MLALVCSDMRNRSENIRAVCRRTFDTVSVVNAALARFVVDVKVLEVVVKVDGAGAEIASEKGRVGGEHGRDVDMALAKEGDGEASLPLVEVGDNGLVSLAGDVLRSWRSGASV